MVSLACGISTMSLIAAGWGVAKLGTDDTVQQLKGLSLRDGGGGYSRDTPNGPWIARLEYMSTLEPAEACRIVSGQLNKSNGWTFHSDKSDSEVAGYFTRSSGARQVKVVVRMGVDGSTIVEVRRASLLELIKIEMTAIDF